MWQTDTQTDDIQIDPQVALCFAGATKKLNNFKMKIKRYSATILKFCRYKVAEGWQIGHQANQSRVTP